jgi:hypothetical protein
MIDYNEFVTMMMAKVCSSLICIMMWIARIVDTISVKRPRRP